MIQKINANRQAVNNHWTGLVDWTGGLDWWTGLSDVIALLCNLGVSVDVLTPPNLASRTLFSIELF